MSFLAGIVARNAVKNVALKSTEKVVAKQTFSNAANLGGRIGLGVGAAGIAFNGINSLADVAQSSLSNVSQGLSDIGSVGGDTLSKLGENVAGGFGDSIILLGGAAVVLFILLMPSSKK